MQDEYNHTQDCHWKEKYESTLRRLRLVVATAHESTFPGHIATGDSWEHLECFCGWSIDSDGRIRYTNE